MHLRFGPPGLSSRLSEDEGKTLLDSFKNTITAMSVLNGGNRAWWYTWLASRDRFNARLLRRLTVLASLGDGATDVCTDDPVLFEYIRRTRISHSSFRDLLNVRWAMICRNALVIKRLIGEALWFANWWHAENKKRAPVEADVIIVTQLSKASFKNGEYRDIYFGKLPHFLSEHGEKVVVCGSVQGRPSSIISARNKSRIGKAHTVTSFGAFLRLTDFVPAMWEAIFNGIRCIDLPVSLGDSASILLTDDIHCGVSNIFYGLMIERATARLLRHFPSARLIHMYENNPWEHAVNRQAALSKRETIGFLHCAVLPSHFKNFIAKEELSLRPSPDRIVCTGSAAREVFLSLGVHDPMHVVSGCDLRETRPTQRATRMQSRGHVRSVLVVLEGQPTMVEFLEFMDLAAQSLPDIKFSVREHPALPLESLIKKARISLHPDGLLIENNETELLDAMEDADVVIYQGTTAAMTAVFLGIPVIKFESDEPLEDDPLFQSPHLKRTARTLDELEKALDEFSSLDQDAYVQEKEAARNYVEQYLASPTSDNMSEFLSIKKRINTPEIMCG